MADLPAVEKLYRDVCRFQESERYSARWVYGVYPAESDIAMHIADGELYLLSEGDVLAGSFVVSPESEASMRSYGLHLFAIHPDLRGRGLATEALGIMFDLVKGLGGTRIRLDVLEGNLRAERLYLKMGFRYLCNQKVSYENDGDLTFRVFEKPL
jgi:RimJ/RimL family protein N-acetyltransferase